MRSLDCSRTWVATSLSNSDCRGSSTASHGEKLAEDYKEHVAGVARTRRQCALTER